MRSWVWLNGFNAELSPKVYWRGPKSQGMRGEVGVGCVWREGTIPNAIHCHHQNDFCIKIGIDESHLNVSKSQDTAHKSQAVFEEKREPKWNRTEVLLLTSLTPYR